MNALLEPFGYEYMLNAMWVSAMVGGLCAFLSCYLMLKGWSLIGDALSHSIVPGVAGAYMLGLPFSLGAFLSGGLAAGSMLFLNQRSRLKEDAIIGLIFSSFFGLGLFMVSLNPTSVNIQTIVLGNILAIAPEDIVQLAIIGVVSIVILLFKWKDLMVTFFDENHARAIGLRPERLKILFFTLLAVSTVAALQTVGAFLVICLVVTPGATAWLLTDRFPRLLMIAVAIGSITSFLGAWASYYGRRHRRHYRGRPDAAVPAGVRLCAEARTACQPSSGAGGTPMMTLLLEPFQFAFMNNALLISLLVAVPCALLSVFLVLKGWALMGDAMSHAVFPGVVLAWMMGLPLALGAFVAGLFCAVATGYLKDNSRIKQDTVMGIVFSGMFGAGLILYIAVKPEVHLDHILFGDMLGINGMDILQSGLVAGMIALVIGLKWRDFLLFCFDYQQAQASGLRTRWLHYGLLCMVSLTIVATLKAVGIILSISLLIAPGAVAVLITRRFHMALLVAVAVSALVSVSGVYASFYLDSAPAPTIVVLFAMVFIVTFVVTSVKARRQGV